MTVEQLQRHLEDAHDVAVPHHHHGAEDDGHRLEVLHARAHHGTGAKDHDHDQDRDPEVSAG